MPRLNLLEETRFEKVPVTVYKNEHIASRKVALRIADLIRRKQEDGDNAVLGLATGATPVEVYAELVRMHREEGLSFKNVITFNLDEYYPMQPSSRQSYVTFMYENLFDHIDIPKENIHIPDGTLPKEDIADSCIYFQGPRNHIDGLAHQKGGNHQKSC